MDKSKFGVGAGFEPFERRKKVLKG
jgi:hypothetical protein